MIKWNIDTENYTKEELEKLSYFLYDYDSSISNSIDDSISFDEFKKVVKK